MEAQHPIDFQMLQNCTGNADATKGTGVDVYRTRCADLVFCKVLKGIEAQLK